MLSIRFRPEADLPELVAAADEYQHIWDAEGERIVASLERLSGLRFAESAVEATVFEGVSRSHPLRLRASYPSDVKLATLIHELGHRLLATETMPSALAAEVEHRRLASHKRLNLILFDAWTDLYGDAFARRQVTIESRRQPFYREAWGWALAMDRQSREATLRRLVIQRCNNARSRSRRSP